MFSRRAPSRPSAPVTAMAAAASSTVVAYDKDVSSCVLLAPVAHESILPGEETAFYRRRHSVKLLQHALEQGRVALSVSEQLLLASSFEAGIFKAHDACSAQYEEAVQAKLALIRGLYGQPDEPLERGTLCLGRKTEESATCLPAAAAAAPQQGPLALHGSAGLTPSSHLKPSAVGKEPLASANSAVPNIGAFRTAAPKAGQSMHVPGLATPAAAAAAAVPATCSAARTTAAIAPSGAVTVGCSAGARSKSRRRLPAAAVHVSAALAGPREVKGFDSGTEGRPAVGGPRVPKEVWEKLQDMKGQYLRTLQDCFVAVVRRSHEPTGLTTEDMTLLGQLSRLLLGIIPFLTGLPWHRIPLHFTMARTLRLEGEVRRLIAGIHARAATGLFDIPGGPPVPAPASISACLSPVADRDFSSFDETSCVSDPDESTRAVRCKEQAKPEMVLGGPHGPLRGIHQGKTCQSLAMAGSAGAPQNAAACSDMSSSSNCVSGGCDGSLWEDGKGMLHEVGSASAGGGKDVDGDGWGLEAGAEGREAKRMRVDSGLSPACRYAPLHCVKKSVEQHVLPQGNHWEQWMRRPLPEQQLLDGPSCPSNSGGALTETTTQPPILTPSSSPSSSPCPSRVALKPTLTLTPSLAQDAAGKFPLGAAVLVPNLSTTRGMTNKIDLVPDLNTMAQGDVAKPQAAEAASPPAAAASAPASAAGTASEPISPADAAASSPPMFPKLIPFLSCSTASTACESYHSYLSSSSSYEGKKENITTADTQPDDPVAAMPLVLDWSLSLQPSAANAANTAADASRSSSSGRNKRPLRMAAGLAADDAESADFAVVVRHLPLGDFSP